MKNLSAIISLSIITLCAFTTPKSSFEGLWSTSTETTSFDLDLKQKGNIITGSHTSVMQNGNRIDDGDGEVTIHGKVDAAGLATVTFKSGYGINNTGKATIKHLAGNKVEWQIVTQPKGDYYIPEHAILTPEKK